MLTISLDDPRWLELVASAEASTPFHHPAWARLLADAYGYPAHALVLPGGEDRIDAGVPVLEVGGGLRRRRYVSLPFTDSCPPLVRDGDITPVVEALVRAHASGDVPRLELRADLPVDGGVRTSVGVLHRLALDSDPDRVFAGFHKSRVQQAIARAEREGVRVHRAETAGDLADVFFRLHVETRSRLGAPVQPRRYFRLLWERMIEPGLGFLLLASVGRQPVAGAVFLVWKRTVIYKYGASAHDSLRVRPNHALLWHAIRWAAENGHGTMDFGRSDPWNAGLRSFKSGWGAKEEDLVYTHLGAETTGTAVGGRRLLEPVLRRSPEWVARVVGELFYRYAA